ncbi:MAG: outer membrane beta-barrel protein [Bacteroidota bacterium]
MMKRIFLLAGLLTASLCGTLSAQLLLGPNVSGGMNYANNLIVDDTSQYYLGNSASLYASGGLDILYQFDDNIRAHIGGGFTYRQYNLQAPEGREGLSFTNITRNATAISIPMTIHYRIPLKEEGGTYLNIIAGHSLDLTMDDSTVINTPNMAVDSGGSFTRHEYQNFSATIPTVLLGAGLDFQSESGNVLNLSLVWGIGTGQIFRGNVQEWETLNGPFDPNDPNAEVPLPEEFPEHYFDWALRGSQISLRVSYWFNLLNKKDKAEEE